ncbi:MAG: hypothetical protein PHR06_11455 [Candidatus Cloacimonetes bacterium]|nr:hypothetical protein [Candidatus Cloacimonadota bacterium]
MAKRLGDKRRGEDPLITEKKHEEDCPRITRITRIKKRGKRNEVDSRQ